MPQSPAGWFCPSGQTLAFTLKALHCTQIEADFFVLLVGFLVLAAPRRIVVIACWIGLRGNAACWRRDCSGRHAQHR